MAKHKAGGITYVSQSDLGNLLETQRLPKAMPAGYDERKGLPIVTGCLDYFPDALLDVAYCSKIGSDQHNPGEPLHWAKDKSADEVNTMVRHLMERGTRDTDGVRHSAKVAWRALANLQREIEDEVAQKMAAKRRSRRGARRGARRG